MRVRICVDCGEEFRPEVVRCSDCGGALEDHEDGGATRGTGLGGFTREADPASSPGEGAPLAFPVAWASHARDLVAAADRLKAHGLAFAIAARGVPGDERPHGFEIRVGPADAEAAHTLLVAALPDPSASGVSFQAPPDDEPGPDDPGEGGAEAAGPCPACGAAVPAGTPECPDCGLALGAPADDEPDRR